MRNLVSKTSVKLFTAFATLCIIVGCASKKNTATSRFYHSFNARYNTYFNGSEAFKEGYAAQEKINKDNYMELIPLYMVSNKATQKAGNGNFNKAIEKAEKAIKRHSIKKKPEWTKNRRKTDKEKAYYGRMEYNPFIWKAWLLLGESQFHKGEFNEAAATFSYMERLYINQPDIIALARIWKARCYAELGWLYEADDAIAKTKRDSIPTRLNAELSSTLADYYIRSSQYEQAIPHIKRTIKKERHKLQKAREYYLLGQILLQLGRKQEADKALKKVVSLSPPYELSFNARIKMAEASTGSSKQIVRKLTSMAKSEKNKDLLDQIYYAIGNVYLNRNDTLKAVKEYETGLSKATQGGISKSILALQLAEVYWAKWDYVKAYRCYRIALQGIDNEYHKYEQAKERSEMLEQLAPQLEAIHKEDSLRALALMSETERFKVIDRIIEQVKKDEAKAKRDAEAANAENQQQNTNSINRNDPARNSVPMQNNASWYFYNQQTVQNGMTEFKRRWGNRKLEDNWRRENKTMLSLDNDEIITDGETAESTDTLTLNENQPSNNETNETLKNDNKNREFYLKNIPLTAEAMSQSTERLSKSLFNSGVLLKDKVENFVMAKQMFDRLMKLNPKFEKNDEALFYSYQINARTKNSQLAEETKTTIFTNYPDSKYTKLLSDPNYALKATFGKQIEDSIYTASYEAYCNGNYDTALAGCRISETEYPQGANRARFIFLEGVCNLQNGNKNKFIESMKELAKNFPSSDIGNIAGYTMKGIQEGRRLSGTSLHSNSIWELRQSEEQETDSTQQHAIFTVETNTEYAFVVAYEYGTVNDGQMLYDIANYNFSNFMVRNFELRTESNGTIGEIIVSGFLSYDEAMEYKKRLFSAKNMMESLKGAKSIIISEENLARIGKQLSFADYDEFFRNNFTTIAPAELELDDAEPVIIDEEE